MKLPFQTKAPVQQSRIPKPSTVPEMEKVDVATRYLAARTGGDYTDYYVAPGGRLLFLMMDIAGKRENALHVAAAAQDVFRSMSEKRFSRADAEDSAVITDMLITMNKTVITEAGGVCCAPAFLGCYQQDIHVLTYINAGHTPAVLRDSSGIQTLDANGLPLGLFSHSTHDSQFCALTPQSSLAVVSRGLVETRTETGEFGVDGVKQFLNEHKSTAAQTICQTLLDLVVKSKRKPRGITGSFNIPGMGKGEPNDVTVLALYRHA